MEVAKKIEGATVRIGLYSRTVSLHGDAVHSSCTDEQVVWLFCSSQWSRCITYPPSTHMDCPLAYHTAPSASLSGMELQLLSYRNQVRN